MKLSELEDADQIVTKQYLDLRLDGVVHQLSDQFHKEMIELVKWLIVILMGFATLILGGMYFMLAHYKP